MIASGKRRLRGLKKPGGILKEAVSLSSWPTRRWACDGIPQPRPPFFFRIFFVFFIFYFLSGIGNHKMSIVWDMKSDAEWDSLIVVR